ncbi:LPS biosynthesis protein [Paraburkholderia ginsengiterrae]|uniref:LPS-assembly protein LptD n=1 Tax=Paraburkholderia ginsengiterrae TaxID=1462993 RepID=A0A1A9N838_9BURK|nr:LPS biosynthesis protein [Paraburkholderia ginsengiterrae]OAJ61292.1 LPS biosynthesis protein [Paraburkholderia ginsengiterrae]
MMLTLPLGGRGDAHAQETGAAVQTDLPGDAWALQFAPRLDEHPLVDGQTPFTFALGMAATATTNQDLALRGAAELRRARSVVKADAIHYDADTDMADAYGHVHLTNDGNTFIGPEAHYQLDSGEGTMTLPAYHFNLTNGSGSGVRADLLGDQRETIYDGTYTTCSCTGSPAWYLRASRLDLDSDSNEGVAHNGVLVFAGMPLFASPWISFPLNGDRRTGVLPPTFSISSTNGYDIAVPIYFNLAPNYDLTLTPRLLSKRGAMLTTEFRYLSPSYSGTLSAAVLPDDATTHTNRYSISFQHRENLGDGLAAYAIYNQVSDASVTTDLAESNALVTGSQTLFQQEVGVTYNHGPWSILTRVQNWQSFTTAPPYNRAPELDVKYARYNVGGLDFGAEANATRFTIPTADSTEGDRVTFDGYVDYPIVRPGWFVMPKLQWHAASYDLTSIGSDAPAGQPRTFNYNVPTLSFDTGAVFERSVELFGTSLTQTLEPRLYYVYTPYRNQTYAPIFDTAPEDFGLAEIFTSNRFVGGDRVSDMDRLTAGVTSRFIDASSGAELARLVLAQEYYFRSPEVTMAGDIPPSVGPSDLIAGATLHIGRDVQIDQAVEYNQSSEVLTQATSGFSWKPAEGKVFNAAYLYARADATLDDEAVNQIMLSVQWPLTRRLSGVGLIDYDVVNHRIVTGLAGFQYSADCWALSLALEKYTNYSTTTTPTTGTRVLMQLQLNGVSRIDNGLLQQFRANVPGYATPTLPASPSRFEDYP